jgi:hypothetical protein
MQKALRWVRIVHIYQVCHILMYMPYPDVQIDFFSRTAVQLVVYSSREFQNSNTVGRPERSESSRVESLRCMERAAVVSNFNNVV